MFYVTGACAAVLAFLCINQSSRIPRCSYKSMPSIAALYVTDVTVLENRRVV